jgi:hypothetical protein
MVLPKKSQFGTPNPEPWYGFTENKEKFSQRAKPTKFMEIMPLTKSG